MQKKLKLAMITTFLLLSLATISSASAAQYNITDTSYSTYFNTSGYITNNDVQAGDVFDIKGDINNKYMYIDRPLNITSSDRTGQIINGTITILSGGSGTNVTYLNITNTKTDTDSFGIRLIESNNNRIIGNNITTTGNGSGPSGNGYFTYGVYLEDSSNNLFDSNTIKTTGISADADWTDWQNPKYATIGVYLNNDSDNNKFTKNTITTNYNDVLIIYGDSLIGTRINGGSGNQFTGNHINTAGNTYTYSLIIGGTSTSPASHNVISGNAINSNGVYYANGVEIDANTNHTVVSQNIVKVVADSFAYGIYLAGAYGTPTSLNVNVTGNKVTTIGNINYVMELTTANDNTITDNVLVGIGNYSLGIGTFSSSNNTIKHNTITTIGDNSAEHIYNPDTISEGNEGIKLLSNSNENIIQYNIINSAAEYAINGTGSSNNTITNNYLISDNGNKQGNSAVSSGTVNTVTGNYGKKPVADFTVNTNKGKGPLTVEFINTSQGDITDWAWDFDNNGVVDCEAQYSTYTYTKPGTYIAKLTVTGPGGSDSKIIYITVTDTVKPIISSINPVNNAVNVPAGKTIKVTFNENIKAGSNWIELKNKQGTAIPFTSSISGKVLTIKPTINLAESLYTLIIHTGAVTDLSGNKVAAKTTKFSVGTPPKVTKIDPANGATSVAASKTIKVTFNENIKKTSKFWIELKNSAGKAIPFKASVSGKTLTIKPTKKLAESQYKLIIHTGAVTDLAGNPVAAKTTKFRVGILPTITSTNPKNNAAKISLTTPITIKFNKNITKGTNFKKIYLKNLSTGKLVAITASTKGNTLTIKQTHSRLQNNTYQLYIPTAAVKDQTGNNIAKYTVKFKTR